MLKDARIGFSRFGFIIAAMQMLPNIIWAVRPPAVNALSKNASSSPFFEYGEHILGVGIVILLLFSVSESNTSIVPRNLWTIASFTAILLYWCCWVLYYAGYQGNLVIYAMVLLPPVGFALAGIAEKVYLISALSAVFLVFHALVTMENFPIV